MKSLRVWILVCLGILGTVSAAFAATAADYYQAGLKFYTAKDYTQALPYLNAALKLEPNNSQALQVRGYCYYALGQYQNALLDYQKLSSLNPSDSKLTAFVGQINAKLRAASHKGSAGKGAPAAAGISAGAGAPAKTAPVASAGTSVAVQQGSTELAGYREGLVAVMSDWLKDYRKENQKWPESLDVFLEFLNDSRKHKNEGWETNKYLGLTFTEMPDGALSVKFSFKNEDLSGDAQFTLKANP